MEEVKYMTMKSPTDISRYAIQTYPIQMEEWLEFAWKHRLDDKYKTNQTQRFKSGKKVIGSTGTQRTKGMYKNFKWTKYYQVNNYDLYRDWVDEARTKHSRIYVLYTDAITELNVFFDFMFDELGDDFFVEDLE